MILAFSTRCKTCRQPYERAFDVGAKISLTAVDVRKELRDRATAEFADLTCTCGSRDFDPLKESEVSP